MKSSLASSIHVRLFTNIYSPRARKKVHGFLQPHSVKYMVYINKDMKLYINTRTDSNWAFIKHCLALVGIHTFHQSVLPLPSLFLIPYIEPCSLYTTDVWRFCLFLSRTCFLLQQAASPCPFPTLWHGRFSCAWSWKNKIQIPCHNRCNFWDDFHRVSPCATSKQRE